MDLEIDPHTNAVKCLGEEYTFLNKILMSQNNNKGLYQRMVYVC